MPDVTRCHSCRAIYENPATDADENCPNCHGDNISTWYYET